MKKAILATKVGMTQVWNEAGQLIPVTVLQAGPCVVTQVKTEENDGYESVKVAFGEIRTKLVNKPVAGQLDKAGIDKETVEKANGTKREIYKAGRIISANLASPSNHTLWFTTNSKLSHLYCFAYLFESGCVPI